MSKPTLNIKITEIETGREMLNENTNCIIGGFSDSNGIYCALSKIQGNKTSLLGALCGNKKVINFIKTEFPLEVETAEKIVEDESSEILDSDFDRLIKELKRK